MIPSLRLVRRNFGYKLISLAVAILLYGVAYTQQNPRTSHQVYVTPEVRGLNKNMVVKEPPPGFMVTVNGPAPAVEALRDQGIKATVDVSGIPPGTLRLPVRYDLPTVLRSQVEHSGPQVVTLTLEPKVRRQFGVDPIFENKPPTGFVYTEPIATPRQVHVAGAEANVSRVARVVAIVDADQEAGAIHQTVDLVAQDRGKNVVEGVEIQPAQASVQIGLRQVPASRRLLLSPVFIGRPAPGFRVVSLAFDPQSVNVEGPQELLEDRTSLNVSIDQEGLSKDTTRTVTVTPPAGLRIVGSAKVTVTLRVQPEAEAPVSAGAPGATPPEDGAVTPAPNPNP